VFPTLPGTAFVVNDAAQPPDPALATASDGEFSILTAGKGVVRYSW